MSELSPTAKVIIAIVVVALIGLGLYYWSQSSMPWSSGTAVTDTGLPSGSDTSNAGLDQDLSAMGSNVDQVNNDSANVDASVNASASGSDF